MFKILKKNKLVTALSLLLMTSVSAVVVSTVAWFADLKNFTPNDVSSSVITSYFDSGNGSQASPFVITRPIHYWNLVGLQTNNQLKINGVNFADAELYFQFGKLNADGYAGTTDDNVYLFYKYDNNGVLQYYDSETEDTSPYLNMNYYSGTKAIQPLGSSIHPFLGHIIGNNLTVSNLHINGSGMSDIGIFGYVEDGATIENIYFEAPYIDTGVTNPNAASSTGHSEHSTHTYIGYLAGHVYNASQSFNNVYVNDCRLTNTAGNTNEMINTYGYFGHVDYPSTITADSASYTTEIHAPSAYSAINSSYAAASGNALATRNTEYTASGTYGAAVTTADSGASYSMGSNSSSNPYSLSTIGYDSGDTIAEHIRYFDTTANNELTKITQAEQLDGKPTAWDTYEDGTYLYWDSALSKWQIAKVASPTVTDPVTTDFNVSFVSYAYNSTTYYWKYSNGTLISTSVAPADAGAELNNYYFVFKTSLGSTGISSFSENDDSMSAYIYSPNNQAYLLATSTSSATVPTFTTDASSAMLYNIKGPQTTVTYTATDSGAIFGGSTVTGKKPNSYDTITIFNIGDVQTRYSSIGATYDKIFSISEIADGDTIVIGATKTTETRALSTVQNGNNRGAVDTVISNNTITFVPSVAELTVGVDAIGYYSFYDPVNNGYLYAAGTKDKGTNHLRTSATPSNGWEKWDITVDANNGEAHIHNVNNTHTPYLLYNSQPIGDGAYYTFACYHDESLPMTVTPFIFKRNATSGAIEHYSNAQVVQFTSTSTGEQTVNYFDLHTAPNNTSNPENPNAYSTAAFAIENTDSVNVVFNKALSKVTYTGSSVNEWQKVTTESELSAGDTLIFVYSNANGVVGMGAQDDGSFRSSVSLGDGVSIDTTSTPNKIPDNISANVQQITLEGTSGAWNFNVGSDAYLSYYGTSNAIYTETSEIAGTNKNATIAFSSGLATVTFASSTTRPFQYNTSSPRFACYSGTQKSFLIFKHIVIQSETTTYIGDMVGHRYDSNRVDVVGPAKYTSTYIEMNGSIDSSRALTAADIGSQFYTTSFAQNAITIFVDVTGSRDLGTLFYAYNASSASVPKFATGSGANPLSFTDLNARDTDTNQTDAIHNYLLNLNISNITKMSYCALDTLGKICAVYDSSGALTYPTGGSFDVSTIATYVLVIGNTSGTIQVKNVQYTYNNATGNVGNFGSVDYRTATYNASGAFTSAASQVTNSCISIYYDINTVNQTFNIYVAFDAATSTYNVTIASDVDIVVNIFNYEANVYNLVVNGTAYTKGANIINIEASFT